MLNVSIDKAKLVESGKSRIRVNREYLLRKSVAADFNTYLSFSPFMVFADVMSEKERAEAYSQTEYDTESGKITKEADPKVGRLGIRSIFNKSGAVLYGGTVNSSLEMSDFRLTNNVPLIDTPENRKRIRQSSGYTIKELVEASEQGILGSALYAYSDFMYCKYLGQMPNSYLVTLRRFPTPVDDYISSAGETGKMRKSVKSTNPLPIGQLVTWMNTPGNDLESILTYSVAMPYEERKAQLEQASNNADNSSKPLNAAAAMFDKTYRDQYQKGYAGGAVNPYISKLFPIGNIDPPYSGLFGAKDQNKTYGPVDAIKKVYGRSDGGIDFDQSFKLTFEYELRSYNGINGRQAMLDLISNILNVTYTTGTFWGGGYTGGGAHQNNIFSNLSIFKTSGGFTNFMDAFAQDVSTVTTNIKSNISAQGGVVNAIKNFLNNLGGMLCGAALNALGRPQKSQVNSLLSPAPTGLWHVTIGNPFHPIMSLGNMILTKTTITHTGPLGLDDFPTGLKVECELTRGKPRDLRGIEMIYMNGNDRIYTSMGPKVFDMYTHAKEYKSSSSITGGNLAGLSDFYVTHNKADKITKQEIENINNATPAAMKKVLKKYFGTDDTFSVYVQAAEQEYGAWAKKEDSTGDTKPSTGAGFKGTGRSL